MPAKFEHIGNIELLQLHKTAFFCSRKISAEAVLKCYEWAIKQRENENCIISGFHSPIEKEVFQLLLKGRQPVILVYARGKLRKIPPVLQTHIQKNRLLILFPFPDDVKRVTSETAEQRNEFVAEMADKLVIGHRSAGGIIGRIIENNMKEYLQL